MHTAIDPQAAWLWLNNWITGFCYLYIAARSATMRGLYAEDGSLTRRVTEWFILLCGVHHVAHPPLMLWGMPLLYINLADTPMVWVSVLAAYLYWKKAYDS